MSKALSISSIWNYGIITFLPVMYYENKHTLRENKHKLLKRIQFRVYYYLVL